MSFRKSLSPDQKVAIIVAGWALILGAEAVALYFATPPAPSPVPVTPLSVQPGAAPAAPGDVVESVPPAPANDQRVFTAPGVAPAPLAPAPGSGTNSGAAASGLSAPQPQGAAPRIADRRGAGAPAGVPYGAPVAPGFPGVPRMGAPRSGGPVPSLPPSNAPGATVNAPAQAAFEAGAAALRRGDKNAARDAFARVVQLAPDNLPSRLNLASLYLELGQPARAIPHLKMVAARDPKNAAVRFTLARALLADKKLDEATPELQKVVQQLPDERAARVLLAQVLFDRKQPAAAYAQWTTLAQNPKDVEAQLQAAALANDVLKKPAEAEKWLRRAVEAAPAEPQPALMLGQLLLQKKDARGAATVLTRAARARPDAFALYPALADARSAAGDLKGATSALQSALDKLPQGKTNAQRAELKTTEGSLRMALGRALGQGQKTQAARAQFEQAATLLPRDPQPRALAAIAALQLKDNAGAIASLREALRLDSRRLEDRKLLAQVLAQNKQWSEADAQFALYDAARPGDTAILRQWAQVAAQRKDPKKQAQILAKVTAADSKDADTWAQLGVAQRESGDKRAALNSFVKLSQLRPADANVRYEMARLQSSLGDSRQAYENWKRVVQARPEVAESYPALLESAGIAGQSAPARQFLVRELSGRENLAAIQGILAFYERKSNPEGARQFLNDLVARDPGQKAARTALEALKTSDSAAPVTSATQSSPTARPVPTVKPMALDRPAEAPQTRAVAKLSTDAQASSTPTASATPNSIAPGSRARLTAREKAVSTVASKPTSAPTPRFSASEPTKIARPE